MKAIIQRVAHASVKVDNEIGKVVKIDILKKL